MSHGPTPAAMTRTRISSGPGSGRPTSSSCRTSGPPNSCTLIASMLLRYEFPFGTGHRGSTPGEPHDPVVDLAVPEHEQVVDVAHAQPPRRPRARLGELVHGPLDVAGREIEQRQFGYPAVVLDGNGHV